MNNFSFLTTFHQKGYDTYGRDHVWYMDQALPEDCTLHVYGEKTEIDIKDNVSSRVNFYDLEEESPECVEFKIRNEGRKPRHEYYIKRLSYEYEHIRFCHKVYAVLTHYKKYNDARYMVWCDADVKPINKIPSEWLFKTAPTNGELLSILIRSFVKHAECGYMVFDTQHPLMDEYMRRVDDLVNKDELFTRYEKEGWNDCVCWEQTMKEMWEEGQITFKNLSKGSFDEDMSDPLSSVGHGHPFAKGVLGEYLDHLKGKRKARGFSPERVMTWEQ